MINQFRGVNAFLSNMYPCELTYNGIKFNNLESLFQSFKAIDKQHEYGGLVGKVAKAKGRKEKLPANWNEVRVELMYGCLYLKFSQNPKLLERLLATGNEELVEGNTWHDTFWGVCTCRECKGRGDNILGKLLMKVREELRHDHIRK